jgi:hypothetical protein
VLRLFERIGWDIKVGFRAFLVALPHGHQMFLASAVWVGSSHAAFHRQPLVVAFQWKTFLVESGGGAVDVTGAGGQEHRQPLRRARVGVVDLRKLARHTELRHVWGEADAEGDSNTDEDERGEARRDFLRLWVEKRKFRGGGAG